MPAILRRAALGAEVEADRWKGGDTRSHLLRGRVRQLPPRSAQRSPLQERPASTAADRRRRQDHTVPASLSHKQFEKYERSPARTDYIEFEGRPHLMMTAEGWEEIAASIETWINGVLETSPATAKENPA